MKSAPSNLSICKISQKSKNAEIWYKKCLIGYLLARIWKQYCHIWNQHPPICVIAKFWEKEMPNFGTKNTLLGYFCARILKNYCDIWNQYLQICLIATFCEETKMPKSGTKNALLGYFWLKMPFLGVFVQDFLESYSHIWNQHPEMCLFAKFHEKTKILNFWTESVWFEYFWAGIWKTYCHIWNQYPRICLIAKFCEKNA